MPTADRVFVDAAGWQCFLDGDAINHGAAVAFVRQAAAAGHELLTTNVVLGELFTLLSCQYDLPRPDLIALVDTLRDSRILEVVTIDPTLEAAAWQLLRAHPTCDWTLAEATSFAVMRARGSERALTANPHYSQAGFTRLLV